MRYNERKLFSNSCLMKNHLIDEKDVCIQTGERCYVRSYATNVGTDNEIYIGRETQVGLCDLRIYVLNLRKYTV